MDEEAQDNKKDAAASNTDTDTDRPEEAKPPSLSKLFSLAQPEYSALVFVILLMLISEGTSLYNPLLLGNAYDDLVDNSLSNADKMSSIGSTMVIIICLHVGGMVSGFIRGSLTGAVGERVVARLRNHLFGSILKQEISFFDEHKSGELVSRLGSDTTLVQQATSSAVPEVVLGIMKVFVCITLMFWVSPQLAGVTTASTLFIFLVCIPFGKKIGKLSKLYQDALGTAQNSSTEALGSIRTVQSFAAEEREKTRYKDAIGDPSDTSFWLPPSNKRNTTYGIGLKKAMWTTGFYTFIFGFGMASYYASIWYGLKLVVDGNMTLGGLVAFQSYIFQIGSGLAQTSRFVSQVIEAVGASGRIFQLLERVPLIPHSPDGKNSNEDKSSETTSGSGETSIILSSLKPSSIRGAIELRHVSFCYPSRKDVPVLQDINLTIPENTTAAFVGSSGAGKSTVVNLIQRFYDVNAGSIVINGVDIRRYDLPWLRKNIGYVQQEPQLFGLTVKENLCYGLDREVSQSEIEKVCQDANAHDFISQWPQKYDTLVGERGVKLSGGQRQRISIARALLVDPSILLLDEATSALDAESEHLVQDAIAKAVVGRTVLVVAHRLSTIRDADQIIVLDDKRIVDCGSHDVLMGRCVKYQDLIKRQAVQS
jgi:ABC-type multidrug transport system fused ATPase/permease subunit